MRDLRASGPGAAVHGVGLGYEGLDDDDSLGAGMVIRLELEADGILGANTLLIGDARHEALTMFPPAAVGR